MNVYFNILNERVDPFDIGALEQEHFEHVEWVSSYMYINVAVGALYEENNKREKKIKSKKRIGRCVGSEILKRYWIPDKVVITHSWNAIARQPPSGCAIYRYTYSV